MENAVDALKIAFAILVFVIALTLAFSVIGQARATSDIVLALNDKTNYYEYVDENDNNAREKDRVVDFETILPTIYRYAKEQYAVTILNTDGTPIVRYDLYTEGFMSGWDETLKRQQRTGNDSEYNEIQKRISIVDNFIYEQLKDEKPNMSSNPIMDSLVKVSGGIYRSGDLYVGKNVNNISVQSRSVAPWMGNPNTDTIYRIQADLGYKNITTQLPSSERSRYSYSDGSYEQNGVVYKGKKLSDLKNRKFIEKFLEIQTSGETITEQDDNNIQYSLETIKGNKKLEIIYILQEE